MFPKRLIAIGESIASALWFLLGALFRPILRLLGRLLTRAANALLERLPDRLAGYLRQRAHEIDIYYNSRNRIYRRSVLASVTIHLVTLILFATIPSCNSHARWVAKPIPVSLVTLPVPKPQTEIVKTTPPVEVKKEKPKPQPKPPAKETKKKEAPKIKAPPKTDTPKPVAKEPDPPKKEEKPEPITPKPTKPTKQLDATRIDETGFAYDYYLEIIKAKIAEAWAPPAGQVGLSEKAATILRFRINRNGSVSGFMVEQASPVFRYDESARQAVVNAQPFPPFPPAFTGQWLTVHMRFMLSDWLPAGGQTGL